MTMQLSQEDKDDLTPDELAALMADNSQEGGEAGEHTPVAATTTAQTEEEVDAEEAAAAAATDKPEPTAEEIAAAAEAEAAAKAGPAAKTDETTPSAEDLAALLEDDDAPAPVAPKGVTYKGITDADYKAGITKLDTEKAEGLQQLLDGTIDAAAYAKIESDVAARRDELVSDRTLAKANHEAAEHANATKLEQFQAAIGALMKTSAQPGALVNYATDAKAQKQFDAASRLIAEDPDNADMTPQQVCDQAHAHVLALRGLSVKAAAPTPPAPPKKDPATKTNPPPVTLSGLPAAAPNATGNDLRAQFDALEGEEAEEFLERLPEKTREALMSGGRV